MKSLGPTRGDIIWIQCLGFKHPAVYLGRGLVADNSWARGGSAIRPISEAVGDRRWTFEVLSGTPAEREWIAARSEALAGRRSYSVFTYNCEHFVCEVLGIERQSPQLRNAVGAAALLVFTGALLNSFVRAE